MEDNKQQRKQYAKKGERAQKMMSFRIDGKVAQFLEHVQNKGRLLNELVTTWAKGQPWYDEDSDPAENDLAEYET